VARFAPVVQLASAVGDAGVFAVVSMSRAIARASMMAHGSGGRFLANERARDWVAAQPEDRVNNAMAAVKRMLPPASGLLRFSLASIDCGDM